MVKLDPPITIIPGISATTGTTILSELVTYQKFDALKKIVAYAVLDASVKESDNFIGTKISFQNVVQLNFAMHITILHLLLQWVTRTRKST